MNINFKQYVHAKETASHTLVDYAMLDNIYDCYEKEAITIDYTNNSHCFHFTDMSYVFVYFGYTYTSITAYSPSGDIIAYFYAKL